MYFGKLRALWQAGLLSGGSWKGTLLLLRNVLHKDFHPSTIWALNAANFPNRTAIVNGKHELSWSEVNARINRLANGLLAMGICPGDRVAFMLKNSVEWFDALAACSKIGVATVFVSYRSTLPEISYLISNSEAKALIFHTDFSAVIQQGRTTLPLPEGALIEIRNSNSSPIASYTDLLASSHEGEPDRELRAGGSRVILYTSGTTGKPKGAVRNLSRGGLGTLLNLLSAIPFRRSDRHLVAAPLYHVTASGFATIHVTLGATIHIMEHFDPVKFLEIVEREKITTTAIVPTMLQRILELPTDERDRYDVSSLRVIICTGSALAGKLKEEAREALGPVIYDLYGATEMGWVTVATPDDQLLKPASVGKPVPGTDFALLSEDRQPVADGEVGEIFAKNDLTIEGYHANDQATADSRWNGFFSVGDLAVRDADGYITLVDRKTDMIISGGINTYPAETEAVLVSHPKIREAAVIGIPDEKWGEALLAFVVQHEGQSVSDEELMVFCREQLAGYKVPRRFERLPELPRNPTGKILKQTLRQQVVASTETIQSH